MTIPELHTHCEVLDQQGRSLCVLPMEEVMQQGLIHKSVAVLATDGQRIAVGGKGLASAVKFQPLPAGVATQDFAQRLLEGAMRQVGCLHLRGQIEPCEVTEWGLTYVYESRYSPAMLSALIAPPLAILDMPGENLALLDPLLKMMLNL